MKEVRTWLAARYAGGPVDVGALLPATITIAHQNGSTTGPADGIPIGIRIAKSKAELYSTLIHEAHHAVNFASGASAGGPDGEGAATAAERRLLTPFLTATLTKTALAACLGR